MTGPGMWHTTLVVRAGFYLCPHAHPALESATPPEPPWPQPDSPLDTDGVGVLCAAARQTVWGVDGD